jgi:tripartite-type tricarboxylate transporter receptor subunit TctC
MMIVDLTPAQQLIEQGKLRAFAVTSPARARPAPNIPTMIEAGLPGYSAEGWFGLIGRKGMPTAAIDKINKIVSGFIKRPEVQDKVYGIGIQPKTDTPEEFAKFIPAEQKKWAKVIADAHIPKMN